MIVVEILIAVGVFVSFAFWLMALLTVSRLKQRPAGDFTPPVTVLKPVRGADDELETNLRSFCTQLYPNYRIIFGVADERDPAVQILRKLRDEFPDVDISIVTGTPPLGANAKVANLAYMASLTRSTRLASDSDLWGVGADLATVVRPVSEKIAARGSKKMGSAEELWVISDADVRVGPDWLRHVATPFADEGVGLVSCFYRVRKPQNLAAALEAFQVNVDFLAGVLIAEGVMGMSVTLGATMAVRRTALEKLGGFAALAEYLADDYQLGRMVAEAGYRVELSSYVVDVVSPPKKWKGLWTHQVRWARTYRVCQPVGFFFSIFSNATLWGLLGALLNPWSLAALLALRLFGAQVLVRRLTGERGFWEYLWLAPVRDAMSLALWFAAWGNTVEWGGREFLLRRDGTMEEIAHAKS